MTTAFSFYKHYKRKFFIACRTKRMFYFIHFIMKFLQKSFIRSTEVRSRMCILTIPILILRFFGSNLLQFSGLDLLRLSRLDLLRLSGLDLLRLFGLDLLW